jgi:hypothetical protein
MISSTRSRAGKIRATKGNPPRDQESIPLVADRLVEKECGGGIDTLLPQLAHTLTMKEVKVGSQNNSRLTAPEVTDTKLMPRSAEGKLTAFELLVKKFQHPLVNFFRRMGVSTDTEDLTQETFIRLYEYRSRYRARARFNTFLFRVARHLLIDHQRHKRKRTCPGVEQELLQLGTQTGSAQSRRQMRSLSCGIREVT